MNDACTMPYCSAVKAPGYCRANHRACRRVPLSLSTRREKCRKTPRVTAAGQRVRVRRQVFALVRMPHSSVH
jgi:hypothetical protein